MTPDPTTIDLDRLTLDELVEDRVAWLRTFGSEQELPADGLRLLVPLLRELASGAPLDPQRLAADGGMPVDRLVAYLRAMPTEWDRSGERVVGLGLTSIPTQHCYRTGGRVLWVWCAADALMFPVLIGAPATIQSRCAATGYPITIEVTPTGVEQVEPASAVVGYLTPATDLAGFRADACDQNNFYRSAEVAAGWLAEHPQGRPLAVADAFEVFRRASLELWGKEL